MLVYFLTFISEFCRQNLEFFHHAEELLMSHLCPALERLHCIIIKSIVGAALIGTSIVRLVSQSLLAKRSESSTQATLFKVLVVTLACVEGATHPN